MWDLVLSHNNLTDITDIKNAGYIERLYLSNNQISDIKPLVDNLYFNSDSNNSRRVSLYNNPLSQQSIEEYILMLEARGIEVLY